MRFDRELAMLLVTASILIGPGVPCGEARGQCERQRVQAPVPQPDDWFGGLVAMSGEFAAVGFFSDETNGVYSGAVLIYRREATTRSWSFAQKIIPSDNHAGDLFGVNVAMSGDVLAVSAREDDDVGQNAGSVYIYRLNAQSLQWVPETELYASDASADAGFGISLSLANNLLVVGATRVAPIGGAHQAYIFRKVGTGSWQEEAILSPGNASLAYGRVVGTDGETVMVKLDSPGCLHPCGIKARVDVFERSAQTGQWQKVQEIPDPSGEMQGFGSSLDLDDGLAIIAATWVNPFNQICESGYVFRRDLQSSSWMLEARLDAARRGPNTWIGPRWVAIREGTAAIGVQNVPGIGHGVVAIFRQERSIATWERIATLGPSDDAPASTRYGMSIAFDGGDLLVGAPDYDYAQSQLNGPGAVYILDLAGPDCNDNSVCDDLDIANGTSLDLNANGIPDECEGIPGDATGDRQVDVDDLLAVITAWGPCPIPPVPCPADVAPPGDGDGVVNVDDLLQVVLHWTG